MANPLTRSSTRSFLSCIVDISHGGVSLLPPFMFSSTVSTKAMSMYTDSDSAQIGITIMFSIVIIANLVGNMFVCLVIILYQDMRYAIQTIINYFYHIGNIVYFV